MLRATSFFANLSDYELKQIARLTAVRHYEAGAVIIEELAEASNFYIISRGKVTITKKYGNQNEFVLGVYSDGDFFGEMALLDEGRRSATVRAIEPTSLLEISKNDFQPLLYRAPILAYSILKELSLRLRTTGALLVSYLQQRNRRLRAAFAETLRNVARAIESNAEGRGVLHRHTSELARSIGTEMGLSEEDLSVLEIHSLLHDLGAPETRSQEIETLEVLSAAEAERAPERVASREEPRGGYSPLEVEISELFRPTGAENRIGFPEDFLGTATYHVGEIIAVAETFTFLTRLQPDGQRMEPAEALAAIQSGKPRMFDQEVVRALLRVCETGHVDLDA